MIPVYAAQERLTVVPGSKATGSGRMVKGAVPIVTGEPRCLCCYPTEETLIQELLIRGENMQLSLFVFEQIKDFSWGKKIKTPSIDKRFIKLYMHQTTESPKHMKPSGSIEEEPGPRRLAQTSVTFRKNI